MTLAFPNPSRSFDPTVNCVRFSGHDHAIEVSFFIELAALQKLHPGLNATESEILSVFDEKLNRIHSAAVKQYQRTTRKYVCTLTAESF